MSIRKQAILAWVPAIVLLAAVSQAAEGWTPTSLTGAPTGRVQFTGVWTGSRLIVWGGTTDASVTSTGGVYDPATDTWTATSTTGAPAARRLHTAVWTGSKMIVWGGENGSSVAMDSGGIYDPATGIWTGTSAAGAPSARRGHTAVWTGSKMIVWGGEGGGYQDTGAVYDPDADTWTPTSLIGAPSARSVHTAVWTGTRMIVWGGVAMASNEGAAYDPDTDTWTATSLTGAPTSRRDHTAVWTGSKMIVWGGMEGSVIFNTGGIYDPATDAWTATPTTGTVPRRLHAAVWADARMIVWGGWTTNFTNTGLIYDPANDTWTATSTTGAPLARMYPSAAWTGQAMVVWGGYDSGFKRSNTGGVYTPPPPVVLHTLTVSTAGTGSGSVASSPAGISCGSDCTERYPEGTSVTLTPTPAVGSAFASWSGACSGAGACVVDMDAAKSVTATFAAVTYPLAVSVDGTGAGTVTSSPPGIDCGSDCSEDYGHGTSVTLTATPADGSSFVSWSGACSGIGECVVGMTAARSVAATFALQNRILYVIPSGTGSGTVTSSPPGIDCGADCDELFAYGTEVTLTASPAAGSLFMGWANGCSGTGACTLTMDAGTVIYATFDPTAFVLDVSTDGSGSGTVTSSPLGIDCGTDCDETYPAGTEVTLTATAAIGSVFGGWSGDCTGTGPCTVTLGEARSVRATFDEGGGSGFYTVTPCRLADTRWPAGPSGAPSLPANTTRVFPVAGLCGVPPSAAAVAVNVTVVNATNVGHLRLYPAGAALPLTSTINFAASVTRANNAVIPLGTAGEVAVWCAMPSGSADFVLDVTGYFE